MLRRFLGRRAGSRYYGPAAYCSDYALVDRPGYYALSADGKRLNAKMRLVYVDDAPGDPQDGSGHYEIAGRKDPVQKQGRVVSMRATLQGESGVSQ